ncbi:MAG TPA: hypothetical protein VMR45_00830 [Patescibacteria group bacterium]|nr:hypothetical protein [Patescibacteria group bacterium]
MSSNQTPEGFLPSIIDTPYPNVAIGDIYEVTSQFDPSIAQADVEIFEDLLAGIRKKYAPKNSTFYYVSATALSGVLEGIAEGETSRPDTRVGVVHLDKYIAAGSDNPDYFRLNVSRNSKDDLVPRVGTATPVEQQLAHLSDWMGQYDELLFVDDVLAFGSTIPPIVNGLRAQNPHIHYRLLAGIAASGGEWRGIERVREDTGIETEYLTKVNASPAIKDGSTGMTIPVSRDLTVFGGKAGSDTQGTRLSYPYFLPFSKPLVSLIDTPHRFEASEALLAFNERLVRFIGKRLGRSLRIGDLIENGFGYPHSSLESVGSDLEVPDNSTEISDYLDYARGVTVLKATNISKELESKKS